MDMKVMKVVIIPTHGDLDDIMQVSNGGVSIDP
jgi:hypothetical protein